MEYVLFIIGLALLIKAADYFVDSATYIAKAFNISEIIIGATIVSIGTTLPEVMVSATSALKGHGDIAYGNAIGSIICNTSLIAAISLVFAPGPVFTPAIRIPTIFFFSSFILYAVFAAIFGKFTRVGGIILLAYFVAYAVLIIYDGKKKAKKEQSKPHINTVNYDNKFNTKELIIKIIILIVSAAAIALGSNLLVDNGTIIAKNIGVPESVIGLTMIALGTSLPELSTAITSLIKGHSNLSLGNIIGANLFNIVLVSGIATTLAPFNLPVSKYISDINASLIVDLPLAFIVMGILCFPTIAAGRTKRWQGIVLLLIYSGFLLYQFL